MIAALPMYDWPELRPATDAFWAVLAERLTARGVAAPAALDRGYRVEQDSPDLLFAQICGLPFMRGVAPSARLVATPCHDVPGWEGPAYRSAIIVRKGDRRGRAALREGVVAANDPGSLSGWLRVLEELGRPPRVLWTGAHRRSVIAVAEGRADAAAIDALALDLAWRFEPAAFAEIEVAGWTDLLPAPAYIAAGARSETEMSALRSALEEVIGDPGLTDVRAGMRLTGVVRLSAADYAPIRMLADRHAAHLEAV